MQSCEKLQLIKEMHFFHIHIFAVSKHNYWNFVCIIFFWRQRVWSFRSQCLCRYGNQEKKLKWCCINSKYWIHYSGFHSRSINNKVFWSRYEWAGAVLNSEAFLRGIGMNFTVDGSPRVQAVHQLNPKYSDRFPSMRSS